MKLRVMLLMTALAFTVSASAQKKEHPIHPPHPSHPLGKKIECTFDLKPHQMGKVKKKQVSNEVMAARKPRPTKPVKWRPVDTTTYNPDPNDPPVTPTTQDVVVMLDIDGFNLAGTWWSTASVPLAGANIEAAAVQAVYDKLVQTYQVPFTIEITTDEARHNSAPVGKRHRHIITTTNEWYGNGAGGVAYINSVQSDQPSFTFSKLLNYSTKMILEAAAHEIGHALGLHHIAHVDESGGVCTLIAAYNSGTPEVAHIMGVGYYSQRTILGTLSVAGDTRGKTAYCQYQDDVRTIAMHAPLRPVAVPVGMRKIYGRKEK